MVLAGVCVCVRTRVNVVYMRACACACVRACILPVHQRMLQISGKSFPRHFDGPDSLNI